MIKFTVGLFMLFALCTGSTRAENKLTDVHGSTGIVPSADWMRSSTGTWPGMKDGKTYWYKLDKKGGLWWSIDGKKWSAVEDGAWADKDGKWIRIHEGKLVWSTDGKTWSEVPDWKWEGSDGKWYKLDMHWTLWVNG